MSHRPFDNRTGKLPFSGATSLAACLKGLAVATFLAEILVVVGVTDWFSNSGDGSNRIEMTPGSVGLLTLAIIGMVLLPCVLAFLGYALEILVGIYDRSAKPARYGTQETWWPREDQSPTRSTGRARQGEASTGASAP